MHVEVLTKACVIQRLVAVKSVVAIEFFVISSCRFMPFNAVPDDEPSDWEYSTSESDDGGPSNNVSQPTDTSIE